mmetsp:Transcript_2028/g.2855  ORF Transcript_2028/g.2855 Transcript_2028/m.2855 type:complete len:114 (-) Transcript_2028:1916-2257(-)
MDNNLTNVNFGTPREVTPNVDSSSGRRMVIPYVQVSIPLKPQSKSNGPSKRKLGNKLTIPPASHTTSAMISKTSKATTDKSGPVSAFTSDLQVVHSRDSSFVQPGGAGGKRFK